VRIGYGAMPCMQPNLNLVTRDSQECSKCFMMLGLKDPLITSPIPVILKLLIAD
jgi:hypothetical protein